MAERHDIYGKKVAGNAGLVSIYLSRINLKLQILFAD